MKKLSYYIFFMFIIIIIIPIFMLKIISVPHNPPKQFEMSDKKINIKDINNINVYLHKEDIVVPMDFETYIKGVVAAEMPAAFQFEALKAQAIAARTYTLFKMQNINEEQQKYHKDGDICTNFAHCQAWKSNDDLKSMWGFFGYFKYYDKISRAVEQTRNLVIVYDGELINPLFHSTSGGKTENSEDVFLTMLPYLRSVESSGEEQSPKFKDTVNISFDEFRNKLNNIANGINFKKEDIRNIEVVERSEGGRIKKIKIGNKIFNGTQIRSIFNLNSTNFKISLNDNNIIIDTIGYGHGVGMSQFGANNLAKDGKNYEYILKHYYNDVNIVKIKDIEN